MPQSKNLNSTRVWEWSIPGRVKATKRIPRPSPGTGTFVYWASFRHSWAFGGRAERSFIRHLNTGCHAMLNPPIHLALDGWTSRPPQHEALSIDRLREHRPSAPKRQRHVLAKSASPLPFSELSTALRPPSHCPSASCRMPSVGSRPP